MSPEKNSEEEPFLVEDNDRSRPSMRQTVDRSIELEHILELPNESGSEADGDYHHFSYNYNMINRDFYHHTGNYINNGSNGLDTTNSSLSN